MPGRARPKDAPSARKSREADQAAQKRAEIQRIMQLPEVKDDLLRKSNPMNFDLHKCAATPGGELAFYAARIRDRLLQMHQEEESRLRHLHTRLLTNVGGQHAIRARQKVRRMKLATSK